MSDFTLKSEHVDVEQIMRQIRARIREKRGVDYTEEEIRALADVKLEKFLDPRGVRSDLLDQFRRRRETSLPPNYAFEDTTIFDTHRPILRFIRRILRPILKLFFNLNPIVDALHIQSKLNTQQAALEPLYYEIMHNLVLELTRVGIEAKNLKMRVESMSSRLDFDERRARALEGVVQYRPGAVAPLQPPIGAAESATTEAEQNERRTRRRRRRRRRSGERFEGREFRSQVEGGAREAAPPSDAAQNFGTAAPPSRADVADTPGDEPAARHDPDDREPSSES